MPLIGELLEFQQLNGVKAFNKMYKEQHQKPNDEKKKTTTTTNDDDETEPEPPTKKPKKTSIDRSQIDTKGAPIERSSKKPQNKNFLKTLSNKKSIIEAKSKTTDPRFNEKFGQFKQENFDKYYGFIEDIEKDELKELEKKKNVIAKKRHKISSKKGQKVQSSETEHILIDAIRSKKQRLAAKEDRRKNKEKEKIRKEQEIEAVKQGKKAYYGPAVGERSSGKQKSEKGQKSNKRKFMPGEFRRSAKNSSQ